MEGPEIKGLEVLSGSDSMHMNEPKVRACTITVGPAVTSDLSSQEHRPPDSPEESMLVPAWLWETIQHQENQESREKPREPATPQPCPGENDSGAWTADLVASTHAVRFTSKPDTTSGPRCQRRRG